MFTGEVNISIMHNSGEIATNIFERYSSKNCVLLSVLAKLSMLRPPAI